MFDVLVDDRVRVSQVTSPGERLVMLHTYPDKGVVTIGTVSSVMRVSRGLLIKGDGTNAYDRPHHLVVWMPKGVQLNLLGSATSSAWQNVSHLQKVGALSKVVVVASQDLFAEIVLGALIKVGIARSFVKQVKTLEKAYMEVDLDKE